MFFKNIQNFFKKRKRVIKTRTNCQKILKEHKNKCNDIKKNTELFCKQQRQEVDEEIKKLRHDALVEAQKIVYMASTKANVLTIEMYHKDIVGRPFTRLAPLVDEQSYENLKKGTGPLRCKLIFPDGSAKVVDLIKFKG